MIGESDNNRSKGQGRCREAFFMHKRELKEVRSKGAVVGTRTVYEAGCRAMRIREVTKSNCHRKTHQVETGDASRKFMHLTRGGLLCESAKGVSRGHSSEDAFRKVGRAKGRKVRRGQSTNQPSFSQRVAIRNIPGAATAAATWDGGAEYRGGFLCQTELRHRQLWKMRKEVQEDA